MNYINYPVFQDSPSFCWFQAFANRSHTFEVWLGVPDGMGYFSTPDMPANPLGEALLLIAVIVVTCFFLPILDALHPHAQENWLRVSIWRFVGFLIIAWAFIWGVSYLEGQIYYVGY